MRTISLPEGALTALAVLLATSAGSAWAHPIPQLRRDADGWHAQTLGGHDLELAASAGRFIANPGELLGHGPLTPLSPPPIKNTDVLDVDTRVTLSPPSAVASVRVITRIRAEQSAVSQLYLYFDQGLSVTSATADVSTVSSETQLSPPYAFIGLTLDTPLAAGSEAVITVQLDGTLQCSGPGGDICDVAAPGGVGVLMSGSAIPHLLDESSVGLFNPWGATRTLELELPSGTDAIAPGELVLDDDDGTRHTTRWVTPGYHSAGGYLAAFGDFGSMVSVGTSPQATIRYDNAAPMWADQMTSWTGKILPFLDAQAGAPLPLDALNVLKLPTGSVLPGTAGHGFVLLSEIYGAYGERYFEETLAHEMAHEWWGVVVSPTDVLLTRWLVEGLATLSQIDYAANHFAADAGVDAAAYRTRRYREHDLLLRYTASDVIPAVAPLFPAMIASADDTLWAYIRSSAALAHLRVLIGEQAFATGLQQWAAQCVFEHCDTADFQQVLEAASGQDLSDAFQTFVHGTSYPAPSISFSEADGQLHVSAPAVTGTVPVELLIRLDDGSELRELATFPSSSIAVPSSVRSVRPNPISDAVLRPSSAQPGDVDFDLEVDGFDLIHCARQLGLQVQPGAGTEGLQRLDLDFDPRCDSDGDGNLRAGDLAAQFDNFGTLREDP
jgi:hypothetical protein